MNDHVAPSPPRFEDLRFILRGNKRGLLILGTVSIFTAVCETFLLAALVRSVSAIASGRSSVSVNAGPVSIDTSVTTLLASALLAALVRGVLVALVAVTGPRITAASRERHRGQLFDSYLSADWATQSADKTGRLVQTLSSSVNDANSTIALLTQALPALLTLVVLLSVALILNPVITGCLIVLGAAIGIALRPLSVRGHRASRIDAAGRNATASHVAGVLAAGAEIAVLGSRRGVLDVGLRRIHVAERAYARGQGLKRLVSTASQSIALILAAGGLLFLDVSDLDVNFTTVGTITVLLLRGAGLAQQVQTASSQYGTIVPFIEQIRTLHALYSDRRQRYGTAAFPTEFDIALDGAEYTYPGGTRPALRVERALFARGTSIAVVGPSGSGKSTLIQLILRLRTPTRGTIRIGEISAESISEADFTERVAYVPQSPHLVPGTVFENIAFFRPGVTEEAVYRAARLAHIHDDIERMPAGYDTVIDAHVDILSGGQKQRLALARALTRDPWILVLDEPTSALDAVNELAVVDTLRQLHGRTTVIIITHKMSTVAHCDSILLVEHGSLRVLEDHERAAAHGPPPIAGH